MADTVVPSSLANNTAFQKSQRHAATKAPTARSDAKASGSKTPSKSKPVSLDAEDTRHAPSSFAATSLLDTDRASSTAASTDFKGEIDITGVDDVPPPQPAPTSPATSAASVSVRDHLVEFKVPAPVPVAAPAPASAPASKKRKFTIQVEREVDIPDSRLGALVLKLHTVVAQVEANAPHYGEYNMDTWLHEVKETIAALASVSTKTDVQVAMALADVADRMHMFLRAPQSCPNCCHTLVSDVLLSLFSERLQDARH
jgi:hypothetical protein